MTRRTALVVVVAGAMALAACGGAATSTGTTAPGPTGSIAEATSTDSASATTTGGASTTTATATATGGSSSTTTTTTTTTTTGSTSTTALEPATMGEPEVSFVEVGRFDRPLDIAVRPDDPAVYVVEQPGRVVAADLASGSMRTVLDVTDLTDAAGERGLLGLAFHPDGAFAYTNHTDRTDGDTHITEYRVTADGTFDRASMRSVLVVDQPYRNHNGGDLEFGPDGRLYIGLGDGGASGDPQRRALRLDTFLGKLLRIEPTPSAEEPYTVPADNPFVGTEGALPELFSIGLRNPWKFAFDPVTDDLWIADVGQNRWEEINYVPAPDDGTVAGSGASFGWSAFEGTARFNDDVDPDGHVPPVWTYEHGSDGCSISGGAPYRGEAIPELRGGYVYSDYCSGTVWAFDPATRRNVVLGQLGSGVTAVVAGPDGELYVTSASGPVHRIVPT